MKKLFWLAALAMAFGLSLPLMGIAQEEGDEAPSGPPVHEAARSIEAPIGQDGASMRLGNGMTLLLPPGLPIGNSRILTFERSRRNPRPASIYNGFRPVGPSVAFNGAINAERSPLVLTLRQPRFNARNGFRLVLVGEEPGLCQDHNRRQTMGNGLCSEWRAHNASYDADARVIRGEIPVSGGHRLQFGWIPEDALEGRELPDLIHVPGI
jgi:hypothetical protein